MITTISNSNLATGIKTALNAKLQASLRDVQAVHTASACSDLQDFINQVNAQKGKKIPVDLAKSLISSATPIENQLGCAQLASNYMDENRKSSDLAVTLTCLVVNLVMSWML